MLTSKRIRLCLTGMTTGLFALLGVPAEAQNSPVQLQGRVEKCDYLETRRVKLEVPACLVKADDARRSTIEAAEQQRKNADRSCRGEGQCRGRNRLARDTASRDAQESYRQTSAECRKLMSDHQDQCRARRRTSGKGQGGSGKSEAGEPPAARGASGAQDGGGLSAPLAARPTKPGIESDRTTATQSSAAGGLEIAPAGAAPSTAVGKGPETSRR